MTVEEILDNITNTLLTIVKYVVTNTPIILLPYALTTYAFLLDAGTRIKKQSYISMNALVRSFKSETILFYRYGNAYVPVLSNMSQSQGTFSWLYSTESSTFYNSSLLTKTTLHNLPMLGANLCYIVKGSDSDTTISIGDLSEWIADQKVASNSADVPLQVLVSTWSYHTTNTMYYNFNNYILVVTDLEGNETAYNLETGSSVPIPTIQTTTNIEKVSNLSINQTAVNSESQSEESDVSNEQTHTE